MSDSGNLPEKHRSDDADQEREYTLSISEENRTYSFDHEDSRWETRKQVKDWIVLGVAIIIWLGFQLSFYFLVPGIK